MREPDKYQGPGSITPERAKMIIEALNPVADLLAETQVAPRPRSRLVGHKRKVEENRWIIWRAMQIAHEALAYQTRWDEPNLWRDMPTRVRFSSEYNSSSPKNWFELRCGAPTKKGEPCKMKLGKGRAHCHVHSTPEENERLRYWQDAIHLPYPRHGGAPSNFAYDQMISDLLVMSKELA